MGSTVAIFCLYALYFLGFGVEWVDKFPFIVQLNHFITSIDNSINLFISGFLPNYYPGLLGQLIAFVVIGFPPGAFLGWLYGKIINRYYDIP